MAGNVRWVRYELGRYVATELRLELVRYIATELRLELHSVLRRWTTLEVDWMWAVVEIAPVPFCGAIRSAFKIYGRTSWSGGSRIYPPETWRFVCLVPRNSEFVELILLEPVGRHSLCALVLSGKATVLLRPWAWRVWVDVVSCDFGHRLVHRRRSMTRSSCSLPPLG
ncbi:hypothetical protein F2Q69_00052620 [Brassica cretica]|uniref:Uncharacterized protein n=1 Tax=Brassica cretica TaxID=69181 RepID=A0A8S9N5I0_BRACR|nr:hypothetical protein F2Q69_00052620 [Brassica cretica]